MKLHQDNLVIRSAAHDDAPILCAWWNDGKVMAHAGYPKGLGITVQEVVRNLEAGKNHIMMLEIGGKAVGEMNYRITAEGAAEIGIKICQSDRQDKGYGTRFLKMLIKHLFDELGFQKIILDTNLQNTRAQHVYEKIGFRKTAVHIDSWQDQLGEWQSSVDYQMTKDEFLLFRVEAPESNFPS